MQNVNSGNQNVRPIQQPQQQQQLATVANATTIPNLHSTLIKNSNVVISNHEASDDGGAFGQAQAKSSSNALFQGKRCSVQSVSNQNNSAPVYVSVSKFIIVMSCCSFVIPLQSEYFARNLQHPLGGGGAELGMSHGHCPSVCPTACLSVC